VKIATYLLIGISTFSLSGCGSFTGLPSHGGGKRFAIEQELVSGTARAAIKSIDLSIIKDKKVALSIVGMGDEGSGTLAGGRASISAYLRGQHINTPNISYPTTTNNTVTGTTTTTTTSTLNSAEETSGGGHDASINIGFNGIPNFINASVLNPKDALFLSSIIQEYITLNGAYLTPIEDAEYLIYVNVDVFGTIRSRTDWLLKNSESLKAKTAIEVGILNLATRKLAVKPQVSSYEAEYNENYVLWMGPISIDKTIKESDGLLSDFIDMYQSEE